MNQNMPNTTKRVRTGDVMPPAPKQKRLERRRERRTVKAQLVSYADALKFAEDFGFTDWDTNEEWWLPDHDILNL